MRAPSISVSSLNCIAIGGGAPAAEHVVLAAEGVGGEGLLLGVGEALVGGGFGGAAVVLMEAHGVLGPAQGVVLTDVGAGQRLYQQAVVLPGHGVAGLVGAEAELDAVGEGDAGVTSVWKFHEVL